MAIRQAVSPYTLQTMISECLEWIDWTGKAGGVTAANAAAAAQHIRIPYVGEPDGVPARPFAVIQKVNLDYRLRAGGTSLFLRSSRGLRLIVSDLAAGADPNNSERIFCNRLGVLLRQIAEKSGGDSPLTGEPYLTITSIDQELEPASPQVLEGFAAEFFDASYLIMWNQ